MSALVHEKLGCQGRSLCLGFWGGFSAPLLSNNWSRRRATCWLRTWQRREDVWCRARLSRQINRVKAVARCVFVSKASSTDNNNHGCQPAARVRDGQKSGKAVRQLTCGCAALRCAVDGTHDVGLLCKEEKQNSVNKRLFFVRSASSVERPASRSGTPLLINVWLRCPVRQQPCSCSGQTSRSGDATGSSGSTSLRLRLCMCLTA
jgi:hypothetical protein